MNNLTRGLLEAGHEVKVLCIATPKHPFNERNIPEDYRKATDIEAAFVDTSLNIVDAFTDLMTADNYNISRFFSPDMDILLIRTLSAARFDVVQLESLFMTPYIPTIRRYSKAPIVLRSHNLEHVIQERMAAGERNILKRPYRKFLAKQLLEHEISTLDQVEAVAAISSSDAAKFKGYARKAVVRTIPFGVYPSDHPQVPATTKDPVFFHLGSMDWAPNEEGVRWLVEKVWPRVVKKRPRAKLHLAGNKMPQDLLDLDLPGLTVKGHVRSAAEFMTKRQIMVVPLFSAGGMRVKIIEGMANGRAILSTTVGAEGIAHSHGKDILLADTVNAFVEQMVHLLDHPEEVARLGLNARKLVERKYDNALIVKDLIALYGKLLPA